MINLSNREKKFLMDKKELIENDNWWSFIRALENSDYEEQLDMARILQFIYFDCNINIFEYIDFIPPRMFQECEFKSFDIPSTVKEIQMGAFNATDLESIIIPKSVVTIGSWAFDGCDKLKYIDARYSRKFLTGCFNNCDNLNKLILSKSKESTLDHLKNITGLYMLKNVNIEFV